MPSENRNTFDRCFLIAEAGINHNGDIQLALELASAAREVEADAVKFQSFTAESLTTRAALSAAHVDEGLGVKGNMYDRVKKLELSIEDHEVIAEHCRAIGITFISTPFDLDRVALLDRLGVPLFKVASMDLTNPILLEAVARTGKPIILSTGMGTLGEVESAVTVLREAGCQDLTLLHCTSSYPPRLEDVNLRAMDVLREAFGCPVGYSDHTMGIAASVAAVARGAVVIEKHFTLNKNLPGPDHKISTDVEEFRSMVSMCREIEAALGKAWKAPTLAELEMRKSFRRSIVTSRPVCKGEPLACANLELKRPGTGIPPTLLSLVQQGFARCDLPADHLIELKEIEWR